MLFAFVVSKLINNQSYRYNQRVDGSYRPAWIIPSRFVHNE